MRFYAQRMKMVVDPTGCLTFAGACADAAALNGARVGVIDSGGNVHLAREAGLLAWNGSGAYAFAAQVQHPVGPGGGDF